MSNERAKRVVATMVTAVVAAAAMAGCAAAGDDIDTETSEGGGDTETSSSAQPASPSGAIASPGDFYQGGTEAALAVDEATLAEFVAAPPPVTENDPILRWTYHLQDIYRQGAGGPTVISRGAAIMYLSIYDAVTSIRPSGEPYLSSVSVGDDCLSNEAQCINAAVTAAAVAALHDAFPDHFDFIDDARKQEEERIGTGPAVDEGRKIGEDVVKTVIDARIDDGSDNDTPYVPSSVPGAWRPTGNGCNRNTIVTPNWGSVRPFDYIAEATLGFAPPLPGGGPSYPVLLSSELYADQFNDVKEKGRATGSTRTDEETQIAFFWANDVLGTYLPPGQHLDHTRIVAKQERLTVYQNARLFGLVSLAMAEAGILAWHTKYQRNIDLWRPETAIKLAKDDNNSETEPDPDWQPLSVLPDGRHFSPCFPAYTSGHATFGGAWAEVMRNFFRTDAITFDGTTDDPNARGVTRRFTSFSAAALEDARSRIYLGVHYQFDADFGVSSGTQLAKHLYDTYLRLPPAASSAETAVAALE